MGIPNLELAVWIHARGVELPAKETWPLLSALAPGKAESWWQDAVRTALSEELAHPDAAWARIAVGWLVVPGAEKFLQEILPSGSEVESALLDEIEECALTPESIGELRRQAESRRWPRLHAWAAMRMLPPPEAFQMQRAFPGDPWPGLELMAAQLPGAAVIAEVLAQSDVHFTELVTRRTVKDPALLGGIDPGQRAWLALWSAHVAAGGECWLPGVSREMLGRALLDAVVTGNEPHGLVAAAAEGLAQIAFGHPKRAVLWDKLSRDGRTALLGSVGRLILRLLNTGDTVDCPEQLVVDSVLKAARIARDASPSPRIITSLLAWNAQLDEDEVVRWLNWTHGQEWLTLADDLGRQVMSRGWKKAAKALYDRSSNASELLPAALRSQELLPFLERMFLKLRYGRTSFTPADENQIGVKIADLGSELAPDGLDDLWERSGGKRKQLSAGRSPAVRWREATALAHQGVLPGGLASLLNALRQDFPYNSELARVADIVAQMSHYQRRSEL